MNGTVNTSVAQPPQYSLPSVSKLFGWTFSFYKQRLSLIAGISAVPFLFGLAQMLVGKSLSVGLVLILAILTFVVSFLSRLALFDAVAEEGQSVSGAYKKSLQMLIPFIWVSGLVTLATLGGFFLLVIPGILLSIRLSLSLYVLFAENRRGTSALVASWHYVKGYWGAIFRRFLFFGIVLLIISLVVAFVTSGPTILTALKSGVEPEVSLFSQLFNLIFNNFLILPLSIIYSYGVYRSLKEIKASVPLESDEQKIKKNIAIFSVIGIVGLIAIIAFAGFLLVKFLSQFIPSQFNSPTFLQVPASSMLASMAFSSLLDLLPFGK
jgi:flagellar biogenesis protein FliO